MNDIQAGNYTNERDRQQSYGRQQAGVRTQGHKPADRGRGHEAVLRAIQGGPSNPGKPIHVLKMDGSTVVGALIAFDKYTLTVMDADGTRRVMFKHDISEFFTKESNARGEA